MSGTTMDVPVKLTGASAVEAELRRIADTGQRSFQAVGTGAQSATRSMGGFNSALQQGGYQVQDFTVQVQGGVNWMVALSQQGSQFLGAFGPTGAAAGAVLTIGLLAAQLLTTSANAKEAQQSTQDAFKGMTEAGKQFAEVQKEINELFLTAAERAAQAANAQREDLKSRTESLLSLSVQRNEGNQMELNQAREDLRRLEDYAGRQEALRERLRRSGQMSPEGEAFTDRGAVWQARARVQGLEQDMSRTSDRIGELNQQLTRLRNAGRVGVEQFGPTERDPRNGGRLGTEEFGPTTRDPFGAERLRGELDRGAAAQQRFAERMREINALRAQGADVTGMEALAQKELNDALRRAAGPTPRNGELEAISRIVEDMGRGPQLYLEDQVKALEGLRGQLDPSIGALERYKAALDQIEEAQKLYAMTAGEYGLAQADAADLSARAAKRYKDDLERINRNGDSVGKDFQSAFGRATSAFEDAVSSGKDLSEVLQSLDKDLARLVVRMTLMQPLERAFKSWYDGVDWSSIGKAFGFSFFGNSGPDYAGIGIDAVSSFADGGIMTSRGRLPLENYASGGVANRPQLTLFGEGRMPEAYVPLPDGRSIPVRQVGGSAVSAGTISISVDARGADAGLSARLPGIVRAAANVAKAEIFDETGRGGGVSRTMGRRR
ncbi:hypothetical protein [Pseudoroseomonas cervicalis]|uniref:hypothetical protein n=1 Tax=Teichococcus cervicalis TaxID=204525 RepID=UPI0027881B0B|nr:hypothetical protein [Pseudoroseomonas cervicalis]MDQ1079693.1 hypothetical protein [Pseudoroseomonas cervicalis]